MVPIRNLLKILTLGAVFWGGVALAVGCSGNPTGPQGPHMMLSEPQLMVAGQVVNGETMQVGHGEGGSTLFRARLTDAMGEPLRDARVYVRYERPGGMMDGMMGQGTGRFRLYDDGTHGDPVAGDGIYCLEDWQGTYGCHASGLGPGDYHYEFWGEDDDGHHTDHHDVIVHLVP